LSLHPSQNCLDLLNLSAKIFPRISSIFPSIPAILPLVAGTIVHGISRVLTPAKGTRELNGCEKKAHEQAVTHATRNSLHDTNTTTSSEFEGKPIFF